MGLYQTKECFFSGVRVITCNEGNGECLDGYYYKIDYNNSIREIRLVDYDWANDSWVKMYGKELFQLIDTTNNWSVFEKALDNREIVSFYLHLKNLSR